MDMMTLREAMNVAWHARVNGIDVKITPQQVRDALGVFETTIIEMRSRIEHGDDTLSTISVLEEMLKP